jgi:hypothetical protein
MQIIDNIEHRGVVTGHSIKISRTILLTISIFRKKTYFINKDKIKPRGRYYIYNKQKILILIDANEV